MTGKTWEVQVKLFLLIVALMLGTTTLVVGGFITPELKMQMDSDRGPVRVKVAMGREMDWVRLSALLLGRSPCESRAIVVEELERFARESQSEVLAYLLNMESRGEASEVRSLWVNNTVVCRATKNVILEVAEMEGVRSVDLDEKRRLVEVPGPPLGVVVPGLEWNVARINARAAWALGYTGHGVVVGHLDTGVNYYHRDLEDHIWTNLDETPGNNVDEDLNGYVDDYHGFDFYNRNGFPLDDNGHGTATAGVIAGDGTSGDTTGVAPDAAIMCLKVTSSLGEAYESDVWEAIEYAIENGANLLNLSLGWMHSWSPDRQAWRNVLNSSLAAGILACAAGGNERVGGAPPPDNIRTPGDVPPPWLHPDQTLAGGSSGVLTVGATDEDDSTSYFSSYGPVSWQSVGPWYDYPYSPGMGLIDPDISAPGEGITSLYAFSNDQYAGPWSGTSFSAPHITGAAALLLSKNSQLSPAMLDSILETTAIDLGYPGKENDYGAGRADLLQAIGVEVDLDIVDNSLDVSSNTMHLYGLPGITVYGEYVLVNPDAPESNPDPLDGPGNSDLDSICYLATDLVASDSGRIPASSVSPNIRGIDSLLWGQVSENLLGILLPLNLADSVEYIGQVMAIGWAASRADTDEFTLKLSLIRPTLYQNRPNPFREGTEISYLIPSAQEHVSLKIYSLSGRLVTTLVNETKDGGYHSVYWRGRDGPGTELSSGVYVYRIKVGQLRETRKMVLLK